MHCARLEGGGIHAGIHANEHFLDGYQSMVNRLVNTENRLFLDWLRAWLTDWLTPKPQFSGARVTVAVTVKQHFGEGVSSLKFPAGFPRKSGFSAGAHRVGAHAGTHGIQGLCCAG